MALADIALAVHASLATVAGATVTFYRGNNSVSVTATLGSSELITDDGYGTTTPYTSHDFIVRRSALVINSAEVTPKPGDTVKRTIGGVVHVYRVTTPPYHPSDADQTLYRIHTKFVETE